MFNQTLTHTLFRRTGLPVAVTLMAMLAASPAFAEGNTATTMTPPAPNASSSGPQSENSLPENAETSTYNSPGGRLATTSVPAVWAASGLRLSSH